MKLTKKQLDAKVNKLASRATADNPVSILLLGQLSNAVREAIRDGLSDDEVVEIGRKFIIDSSKAA